ncbi:hypothetical protein PIB30_054631 [Stylosanthes scabra]|uniref:Uncharacterized protein n=1 Tax=Stylosanthes scabra TaxID=79078 RepID=A0ABU6VL89_9FABA|nr:hypothetical protein [Stylosanthes scabra]
MNKMPEEAWELIESMADNSQHFKVRATFATKGVFEVTPSESTILAKSLVDIAAMLKEIKEGQAATPKLLTQQANTSQQLPMNAPNCRRTIPLRHLTTSMKTSNLHPTTDSITHSLKGGVITSRIDGTHLNNHNRPNSANHTHITNHKIDKTQDTNHLILDKPTLHQMFLHPIMKKPSMPINKKVGRCKKLKKGLNPNFFISPSCSINSPINQPPTHNPNLLPQVDA